MCEKWAEALELADEYVTAGLSMAAYRRLGRLARILRVEVADLVEDAQSFAMAASR